MLFQCFGYYVFILICFLQKFIEKRSNRQPLMIKLKYLPFLELPYYSGFILLQQITTIRNLTKIFDGHKELFQKFLLKAFYFSCDFSKFLSKRNGKKFVNGNAL